MYKKYKKKIFYYMNITNENALLMLFHKKKK